MGFKGRSSASSSSGSSTPPPEYEMSSPGNSGGNSNSRNLDLETSFQELEALRVKLESRTRNQNGNGNPDTNRNPPVTLSPEEALLCLRYCTITSFGLCFVIIVFIVGVIVHHNVAHAGSPEVENRPKFYEQKNYTGGFYVAPPNWDKNGCINLPEWINDKTMSIRVGYHCLDIYEDENCTLGKKRNYEKIFEGSFSHDDLDKIQMGNKITSFKVCP